MSSASSASQQTSVEGSPSDPPSQAWRVYGGLQSEPEELRMNELHKPTLEAVQVAAGLEEEVASYDKAHGTVQWFLCNEDVTLDTAALARLLWSGGHQQTAMFVGSLIGRSSELKSASPGTLQEIAKELLSRIEAVMRNPLRHAGLFLDPGSFHTKSDCRVLQQPVQAIFVFDKKKEEKSHAFNSLLSFPLEFSGKLKRVGSDAASVDFKSFEGAPLFECPLASDPFASGELGTLLSAAVSHVDFKHGKELCERLVALAAFSRQALDRPGLFLDIPNVAVPLSSRLEFDSCGHVISVSIDHAEKRFVVIFRVQSYADVVHLCASFSGVFQPLCQVKRGFVEITAYRQGYVCPVGSYTVLRRYEKLKREKALETLREKGKCPNHKNLKDLVDVILGYAANDPERIHRYIATVDSKLWKCLPEISLRRILSSIPDWGEDLEGLSARLAKIQKARGDVLEAIAKTDWSNEHKLAQEKTLLFEEYARQARRPRLWSMSSDEDAWDTGSTESEEEGEKEGPASVAFKPPEEGSQKKEEDDEEPPRVHVPIEIAIAREKIADLRKKIESRKKNEQIEYQLEGRTNRRLDELKGWELNLARLEKVEAALYSSLRVTPSGQTVPSSASTAASASSAAPVLRETVDLTTGEPVAAGSQVGRKRPHEPEEETGAQKRSRVPCAAAGPAASAAAPVVATAASVSPNVITAVSVADVKRLLVRLAAHAKALDRARARTLASSS